MRWVWMLAGVGLLALAAFALRGQPGGPTNAAAGLASRPANQPYLAVTTIAMISDVVRQVAGERAQVVGLIGEGVDPHLYKPTRNDIVRLERADIILYNGLFLEGKMAEVLQEVAKRKPACAVAESLDPEYLLAPQGAQGHHDPHVWMDVSAWSRVTATVARALSEFDPPSRAEYEVNAARLQEQLLALHEYIRQVIQSVPQERRVLVTAHDAFQYFGRAYGIDVMGIQGISTESEAGLTDINRLVDLLVQRGVRAIFVESSVAEKNVRALVEGAAARGHAVQIGGTLYSDAMGPAGQYEGTYIGMLDHNATIIARALGGEVPPNGMLGRLRRENTSSAPR